MHVPTAEAARAVATSPSGWAMRCIAEGAMQTGNLMGAPNTVVVVSMADTFRNTRGRMRYLQHVCGYVGCNECTEP